MKKKSRVYRSVVAVMVLLNGCATFSPQLQPQDFKLRRQPTASNVQDGLSVAIEEFATPEKSHMAFDDDVAKDGLLPVLVQVENKGKREYVIKPDYISAFLGEKQLPPLGGEQASDVAKSEYVGKAAGWTLLTGPFAIVLFPITIGGSVTHTAFNNRKVRRHFQALQLTETVLRPDDKATGFMYFVLPEKKMRRLENLTVQIEPHTEQGGKLSYKLSLPPLALSKD